MLRGPGYFNMDAGLSRIFTFKEAQRVELRAEATNILNHTNFFAPGDSGVSNAQQTAFTTLTSNNFGRLQTARAPPAPAREADSGAPLPCRGPRLRGGGGGGP